MLLPLSGLHLREPATHPVMPNQGQRQDAPAKFTNQCLLCVPFSGGSVVVLLQASPLPNPSCLVPNTMSVPASLYCLLGAFLGNLLAFPLLAALHSMRQ